MRSKLWILILSALLLLPMSAAMAKKGGNGGGDKPGGGGGSNLPAEELVFTGRPDGSNCVNCYALYKGTANATQLTQLTTDGHYPSVLSVDPTGEVAGALHFDDGHVAVDLGSGAETGLNCPIGIGWTRLRDSGGTLLSYDQQWLVTRGGTLLGPERPELPGEDQHTSNVAFTAADGSGDSVALTTLVHEWNASTQIYTHVDVWPAAYVPQQAGGSAGEAWLIYTVRERTLDYSNPPAGKDWVITSDTTEIRRLTLDVTDLSSYGTVTIRLDVLTPASPYSEGPWGADGGTSTSRSPDGQWALVNRLGEAWLVPVDFSSGAPVIPEPTTADLLPITPPDGWHGDVRVLAVNHDASLVALNLFRDERRGKQGIVRARHLFVARVDGSDLTQIDVGTDGVEFAEDKWDDSFLVAAFVPPSGQ
jgi:hypothetical protein